MATKIGMADTAVQPLFAETSLTLRGTDTTAAAVIGKLETDLTAFLADGTGDLADLLGAVGLPDGSAMYGILLHKAGPAVADFGACPMEEFTSTNQTMIVNTKIHDVKIKNLQLKPQAWISLHKNDTVSGKVRQVQGPAGAVFRATQLKGSNGGYVGDSLSDAMIAVNMVLKKAEESGDDEAVQRAQQYFGASFIPDEIHEWAASGSAPLDYTQFELKCSGDAMSHFNKGIVGVRLEYQDSPDLQRVSIDDLHNFGEGPEDISLCSDPAYKGNDVRALRLTNSIMMGVDVGALTAGEGGETLATEARNT
jgi:hypothetical protein